MSNRRQLFLFFGACCCVSMAMGMHDSVFNNYLSDTFALSAEARGFLELPRELPGFLVFVTAGLLAALPVTGVGIVGALAMAAGLIGLGLCGSTFWLMVLVMMLASAGMHLLQPVGSTIALGLADEHNRGWRMAQTGLVDTFGSLMGAGLVLLLFGRTGSHYHRWFLIAAALCVMGSLFYSRMHIPHLHKARPRMVVRGKFWLYYALEFVFGARKQIFITFGPWVLIRVYGLPATSMAGLMMTASLIGLVFKPLAGRAIDRFGERAVLVADGLMLIFVCVGYGYAKQIMDTPDAARALACACFVADNLLFALGSGRAIYLSRMTESPQELSSTLGLGVSINHIVSMTIPMVAGAIWVSFGYERVFLCAAGLALCNALLATRMPGHKRVTLSANA